MIRNTPDMPIHDKQGFKGLRGLGFTMQIDKWQTVVTIVVPKEYCFSVIVMVDSGADLNFISKGLIPPRYFLKTTEMLDAADGRKLIVNYKLQNSVICNKET